MCCACGGGSTEGSGEDDVVPPAPTPDEDDNTPDEDELDPEQEAALIFMMYDIGSDEKLCLEEFQMVFITYCSSCPWQNAEKMLKFFDSDGDGCL